MDDGIIEGRKLENYTGNNATQHDTKRVQSNKIYFVLFMSSLHIWSLVY